MSGLYLGNPYSLFTLNSTTQDQKRKSGHFLWNQKFIFYLKLNYSTLEKALWPLSGESKVHSLPLTQLLNPKERSLAIICGIKSSFSTLKILLSPKEGSLAIFWESEVHSLPRIQLLNSRRKSDHYLGNQNSISTSNATTQLQRRNSGQLLGTLEKEFWPFTQIKNSATQLLKLRRKTWPLPVIRKSCLSLGNETFILYLERKY